MIGFRPAFGHFILFLAITLVNILVMTSVVILSGTLASNLGVGMIIVMALFGVSLLFSGFFVQLSQIPVWLRWLNHISFIKYSLELVIENEFGNQSFPAEYLDDNHTQYICNTTDGAEVILLFGYEGQIQIWSHFLILIAFFLAYRFLAFLWMYFKLK